MVIVIFHKAILLILNLLVILTEPIRSFEIKVELCRQCWLRILHASLLIRFLMLLDLFLLDMMNQTILETLLIMRPLAIGHQLVILLEERYLQQMSLYFIDLSFCEKLMDAE